MRRRSRATSRVSARRRVLSEEVHESHIDLQAARPDALADLVTLRADELPAERTQRIQVKIDLGGRSRSPMEIASPAGDAYGRIRRPQ